VKALDRTVKVSNKILDGLLTVLFIIFLFIGLYITYDLFYVYNGAASKSARVYKPVRTAQGDQGSGAISLKELSDECMAWVTMDGTAIDYPIMQADNNSKYLKLDPFGNFALAGSIFMDSRNKSDFTDDYTIIYGHHMEGDNMFGALDRYRDEGWFNSHKTGTLITREGVEYTLTAFAVIEVPTSVPEIFNTTFSNNINDRIDYVRKNAMFFEEPSGEKNILALTTCVSATSSGRLIVLVEMTQNEP